MIRFDVETRSKVDLKKVGAWVYSKHPSTEVLVLRWRHNNHDVQGWYAPIETMFAPPVLWSRAVEIGETFEAHNSFFEWCIYTNILVARWGWPPIAQDKWRCSMSLTSFHALPRGLQGAGDALGITAKKDMDGNKVMMQLCKPRKPSKNNKDLFFWSSKKYQILCDYCGTDVLAQQSISELLGEELPPDELLTWQIDQMINKRGVCCDIEVVSGAIEILDIAAASYQEQIQHLTRDPKTGVSFCNTTGQTAKMKEWAMGHGVALENFQAQTVADMLAAGVHMVYNSFDDAFVAELLPEPVKLLLELRQKAAMSSVKKYQAFQNLADPDDNRVRYLLVYHGASTGRWAGTGIQIQNFPRGTFKFKSKKNPDAPELEYVISLVKNRDYDSLTQLGDLGSILSTLLRSMLIAGPGKKFIAADYAAIEARATVWLVGDENAMNVFRVGGDIYVDMAATIYGVPASEVTADQRFVGKQAILGLGYQMGEARFIAQCASYGVTISKELAKQVVKAYREKYILTKNYWDAVNSAAIITVKTGQPTRCGKVLFYIEGQFLKCKLPSGRSISYCNPHFVPGRFDPADMALAYWGVDSQTKKWVQISTYGGKLTENIVQAIAADVLRYAVYTLESNRVPVVLSVHDELVCEVPDEPQYTETTIENLMCQLPEWANGLPVAAEGWQGYRFKK